MNKTSLHITLIAILIGTLVSIAVIGYYSVDGQIPIHAQSSTSERQEALRSLIQGYIADGIILKIEKDSSTPNVYITPLFGMLTASEKRVILDVVLSFFKNDDPSINSIDLFESQSDQSIGQFDGGTLSMH